MPEPTREQLELIADGDRILDKLAEAISNEPQRATMFALTAFCVATCHAAGVPLEQFIAALRTGRRYT